MQKVQSCSASFLRQYLIDLHTNISVILILLPRIAISYSYTQP